MSRLWLAIIVGVSIYCGVQAYRDVRRGDWLMAALGMVCVLVLWLAPIRSQAMKFDLVEEQAPD
jgi:hypothetical protein